MNWEQVREKYPNKWVLLEALEAHTQGNERILEDLSVLQSFDDSMMAFNEYRAFHKKKPLNEYIIASTTNEKLIVKIQRWVGIRGNL